jgi:hypothetical protein
MRWDGSPQEPRRLRLFLEYSVLGTRQPAIRARISAELDRYREAFRTMRAEVIRMEPARFACVTPDGLAAVAVRFINGYAVQAMVDPDHFDIGQYLAGGGPARERRRSTERARGSRPTGGAGYAATRGLHECG